MCLDLCAGWAFQLPRCLDGCVEDHFRYIFSNRRVFWADEAYAGPAATMWFALGEPAQSAPEVVARAILQHVLQEDPSDFAGVEYWARVRSFNLGASFHYDSAVGAQDEESEWVNGNPWRPQWSCVLYLTDGGPTVVLDQQLSQADHLTPELPLTGHVCMPARNRLLVFRGDLHHGSLPLGVWLDSDRQRRVFIFNFWRRHRPEAPDCQRPQLERHLAMQRHKVNPGALEEIARMLWRVDQYIYIYING